MSAHVMRMHRAREAWPQLVVAQPGTADRFGGLWLPAPARPPLREGKTPFCRRLIVGGA